MSASFKPISLVCRDYLPFSLSETVEEAFSLSETVEEPVFASSGRLVNKSLTKRKTVGNELVSNGLAWCKMVGVVELESTTSTMSTWRSNQLSYTPSTQK